MAAQSEVPQEGVARLSAGRCHYRIFGTPDAEKPLTVLVHGINGGKFLWDQLAADFTQHGYAVLTYDLYGRGGSDVTEAPHSVRDPCFTCIAARGSTADYGCAGRIVCVAAG